MKCEVNPGEFTSAISWVSKELRAGEADGESVIIALRTDGTGEMIHYGQSSYVSANFALLKTSGLDKDIELIVNGNNLNQLSGTLSKSNEDLKLSCKSNSTSLSVVGENANFKVGLLNLPKKKKVEYEEVGNFNKGEFFSATNRLAKFCDVSNSEAMPALGSVDIYFPEDPTELTMMATNFYALGEIKVSFTPTNNFPDSLRDSHILLPAQRASMNFGKDSTTETLIYDEETNKLGFRIGWNKTLFPLNGGENQPYASVKDAATSQADKSIIVRKKDLTDAIGVINDLSEFDAITWRIESADSMVITDELESNSVSVPIIKSEFPAGFFDDDGKPAEDAEGSYFKATNDVAWKPISVLPTREVLIKWSTKELPIVLTPVVDEEGVDNDLVFFPTYTD